MTNENDYFDTIIDYYEPYINDRVFFISMSYVGIASAGFVLLAALVGSFFSLAGTFAAVTATLIAAFLILFGPVIDRTVELHTENLIEVVLQCFDMMPEQHKSAAIDYIKRIGSSNLGELIDINLLGRMNVRFKVANES